MHCAVAHITWLLMWIWPAEVVLQNKFTFVETCMLSLVKTFYWLQPQCRSLLDYLPVLMAGVTFAVCLSVCLSVCSERISDETAEWIWMKFLGMWRILNLLLNPLDFVAFSQIRISLICRLVFCRIRSFGFDYWRWQAELLSADCLTLIVITKRVCILHNIIVFL